MIGVKTPVCQEGHYSEDRVPVVRDVFDIADRIKEVDPRYFIMFNTREQKFEIHVNGQPDTTFGCLLPFDELDARTLEYARKYSAARLQATIAEMERRNELLEKANEKAVFDRAEPRMIEAIKYADHHPFFDQSGGGIPKELVNE